MTTILTISMQTKKRASQTNSQLKDNGYSQRKIKTNMSAKRTASKTKITPVEKQKTQVANQDDSENLTSFVSTGMQVICTQDDLANHLDLVSHAVPSKPTPPVLGNVLLIADQENQNIQLSVFDMNLGIQTSFDAQVQTSGEITIPVELLSDIVKKLSPGSITLVNNSPLNTKDSEESVESKQETQTPIATLTASTGRYQIRGLSTEEFPVIPEVNTTEKILVPVEAFKQGLKGTLFATTTDETKRILTGVHLVIHPNNLEFAATDGHRLAVISTSFQGSKKNQSTQLTEPLAFTVPAKALVELERILSSRASVDPVQLSYEPSKSIVEFQWGAQRLVSRCLEGIYPAYQDFLRQEFKQQVTLGKLALVKALERIAVLADKKDKTVNIRLNSQSQELHLSLFREFGNGREEMAAYIQSAQDISISFNIKYFLEGVKAITSSEIQMQLTQQDGPAVLRPFSNQDDPNIMLDAQYLLMPVFKE